MKTSKLKNNSHIQFIILALILLTIFNHESIHALSYSTIAHRGYSLVAPENTIPSFRKAGESGFYGVECDVYETADSNFVIIHDATVDRTTNGSGKITSLTLKDIKNLTIDSGSNISNYTNLKIPTLQEYLEVCITSNIHPVIEIKEIINLDLFLDIINKYNLIDKCTIISFNLPILQKIRYINNTIDIQALLDLTPHNICYCKKYNFNLDVPYNQVTKELVNKVHDEGLMINTWTVNDKNTLKILHSYGVDFITTDSIIH